MAEPTSIPTGDGPMPASIAHPTGPPLGAVVVVQEAFGLTHHIASVCDRFAAAGWVAVAPALFHRSGAPVFGYEDWDDIRTTMGALDPAGLATDLDATVAHLAAEGIPVGRIATVGFCMGGTVSLFAATRLALGAAVTFYGGGVAQGRFGLPPLVELAPLLRAPWLGLYADLDQGIPPEQVEQLRAAAASAPVATEVVRYAAAKHGFHNDDRPTAYDATAAADGWNRTLAFLDLHIASI